MGQIMSEKDYKIVFRGKLAHGRRVDEVKLNLASLLKLSNEKIEQLFCGKPVIVAKNINYDSAIKYKKTFETAGAICSVEKVKTKQGLSLVNQTIDEDASGSDPSEKTTCPKCGFEQEKNTECGRCGIIISKYSDSPVSPPPAMAIPQTSAPLYFSVSTTKFIVMSLLTAGLYEIYWFYKNWKYIKIRTRAKIRPFWRTVFSIFYCYPLFKHIQESGNSHGSRSDINPGGLAAGYIVLTMLHRLPDPFWLVSLLAFVPLIPVQGAINSINATVAPKADRNGKFSVANIVAMLLGSLLLVFVTLDMMFPSSFLDNLGQSEWQEFYSEDANFTVLFPGKPEEENDSMNTQIGTISRQTYIAEGDGGQSSYLVMCVDFPKGVVESANYEVIFDSVRDDLMASYQGQIYSEDAIALDNFPGREFNFEGEWKKNLVYGNVMTFLVEERLYLLMALGVEEEVDPEDAEKFFISFENLN